MTIHIKLFALIRDQAGKSALNLTLPDGATVASAVKELSARLPVIVPHLSKCAFAVNLDYASTDQQLKDEDELAIIPPVSGG